MSQFITELRELLLNQPRYNVKHVNAENSNYADTVVSSRSCYYSYCVFYCEDVYYARYSRKCTKCSGITFCVECEWCTDSVDCISCYMCDNCRDCSNCSECNYCLDCYGCRNCFGCTGLHQKQYCLFNVQLTKENYEQKLANIDVKSLAFKTKLAESRNSVPIQGMHYFQTENCTGGDHLSFAKNCYQCYDAFNMEDCLYNIECNGNKDCMDMTVCFEAEGCYSCVQSPINYNCNFLMHTDQCSDSEFCAYSNNLKNCFGCVYLANKE